MNYQTEDLFIPNFVKKNVFLMFLHTMQSVMLANARTIWVNILLVTLICVFVLHKILPNAPFFSLTFTLLILVNFFQLIIMPLFIALEESLHMGICIQQGKSSYIKNLCVVYAVTKKKRRIIMTAVATKFRGNFTPLDRIQIHGGAPLLVLLVLCMIFIVLLLLMRISIKNLIIYWAILAIFPIGSLVPIAFLFESDGFCIIKNAKCLRMSVPQIFKELLYGILYGLRYIFLGSCCERRTFSNKKIERVLESVHKCDFISAVSTLEEMLKINPDDPQLYNNIAWCYSELGIKLDRAIILAQKALELDPTKAVYLDTLGWCYYKKGDFHHAKQYITKAVASCPHNTIHQNHLKEIENIILKTKQKKCIQY
jgi:hypothetical protein